MGKKKHIVYKITNFFNELYYIGKHSTTTPYNMKWYWGSNIYLKKAIKKYGKENFKRETLFVFDAEEEAFQKEAELMPIELVNSGKVYNFREGGRGGSQHSEETKKKMRDNHCDYNGSNNPNFGILCSEETKKKISDGNKGRVFTEEHKKKLSEAEELPTEIILQRRKDIESIEKIYGWKMNLARRWEVFSGSNVNSFIKKYASDLNTETKPSPIIFQRREDIKNEPKVFGWRAKLSRKWGIGTSKVTQFIRKHAQDLNTELDIPFSEVILQRRKDIKEIPKTSGWKSRLTEKWGLAGQSAVPNFIKKHALDLVPNGS